MYAERARLWWALAAAIALQAFVLYYQLNYGALVGLIPWDDCAIVLRSLENLDGLAQARSFWLMLDPALHLDIHAPVSDIQSIFGLLLTGGAIWGPYALNVLCLCIAIYAIWTTAAQKDSLLFGILVLFLLMQPITFLGLAELKSDYRGAVLIAAAMFVLFIAAEENNNRARTLGAALLGLMLITKLTAFYLPLLALGVFIVFEFYGALKYTLGGKDAPNSYQVWKSVLSRLGGGVRQWSTCAALILGPYLLFFGYGHKALLAYIRYTLTPTFADGLTISERIIYYSPFHSDIVYPSPWGSLHFIFVFFFAAALVAAFIRRAWLHVVACIGVLPIGVVFLAPLALAPNSTLWFGAPFVGTIMGCTLIFLRIFVANTPRWGVLVAPSVVLGLALPGTLPLSPARNLEGTSVGRSQLEHYQSINDDMAEMIARRAMLGHPQIVFTFDHHFMPYPNLSIRYFRRTGHFLSIFRIDDLADPDVTNLLADADFVVTITPTGGGSTVPNLSEIFPISADPALADARVRESGRYELIKSYQVQGGEIWLYQAEARH